MGSTNVVGIDFTLPAPPPLRKPPLSLLDLAAPLVSVEDAMGAAQLAEEKVLSAQADVSAALDRIASADPASQQAAAAAVEEARSRLSELEVIVSERAKQLADAQRWELGFEYLPELALGDSMEVFVPASGDTKRTDSTRNPNAWYDPFEIVAHDDRSLFGWPAADFRDRAQRALRALVAHEPWEAEREFWTGQNIPTNYHLSASPATPTSSARRSIDAWPDPTAAPTTVLGTAVGLKQSMAALDQAIANSDAGLGMIHATPYLVQLWMSTYPYIRDSAGRIYTVNFNLIVPGYGYPGTGPDTESRDVADGVTTQGSVVVTSAAANFTDADLGRPVIGDGIPAGAYIIEVTDEHTISLNVEAISSEGAAALTISGVGGDLTWSSLQWAYATDAVFKLTGAALTYPFDLRQAAPQALTDNSADVRAERSLALITNQLLRAAVLVDTETP